MDSAPQRIAPVASVKRLGLHPDAFHEMVTGLMQPFVIDTPKQNRFSLHAFNSQVFSLVQIQATVGFSIRTQPNPNPYKLDIPVSTGILQTDTDSIYMPGNSVFLPRVDEPVALEFKAMQSTIDFLCIIFRPEQLNAYIRQVDPDQLGRRLPEDQRLPLASPAGQRFQRYVRYVVQELLADSVSLTPSLVLQELQTTLLAMFVELLAADPSTTTISQTASQWGFNNLGHFAVDYRKTFGEPPSATLRQPSSPWGPVAHGVRNSSTERDFAR
jgi:AraC-like DNA-binding protein